MDAKLACDILNHRIARTVVEDAEAEVQMLFDTSPESVSIRSVTSERYTRFYDSDLLSYVMKLAKDRKLKVPPGKPIEGVRTKIATEADCLSMGSGGGIKVVPGMEISPSGLYRGDRDMFIFLVDDANAVDDGFGHPLYRGMFIANSEVGMGSFNVTEFLMQGVCGNHIVWGAKNICQVRYRHIGEVQPRIHEAMTKLLPQHAFKPIDTERVVFKWMAQEKLGTDPDSVVESVYSFRINGLTQKVLYAAYANSHEHRDTDGDPNTWWGFANALTRYSQKCKNADERMAIDCAAGKLFEKAAKIALRN